MKAISVSEADIKTLDDEMVIIGRAQRDSRAFQPLYEKYFKSIYLFVLHRVADKAVAGDVTSQVFLKALLNLKGFKFQGVPFSAWLYRVALNECNAYFRKTKRERIVSIDHEAVETLHDELTHETQLEDLHERLPTILERLSSDELQLLELRFFEKRQFKEVAEILAITESHAKVKLYRLLEKMKKLFQTT